MMPFLLIGVLVAGGLGIDSGNAGEKGRLSRTSAFVPGVITRTLHANRIRMEISDRGGLGLNSGASWIDSGGRVQGILYDQGPWIIGKVNDTLKAALSYWDDTYLPGPILNDRPAVRLHPEDSSRYHPYWLDKTNDYGNSDYYTWPADLGAPVDAEGKPILYGDQTVWAVFGGADSSTFWLERELHPVVLPVEVHQTIYAHHASAASDTSLLSNTVFIEWTFINKTSAAIESCYTALWTDIDFDGTQHNYPAVDTTLQMGYCWDGNPNPQFPCAVGYVLLYGPVVRDPASEAVFKGRVQPGSRNLPLSSFWGIIHGTISDSIFEGGPSNMNAAWNIARGFDKAGQVILDSVSGQPTRFPYSGDPVTKSGWVYNSSHRKGEEGFLMFTGPFTLAPGDTQWMMSALVPALGRDRFDSVRKLRENAARLRAMPYEALAKPEALATPIPPVYPSTPSLGQNYPNPFNGTTSFFYSLNVNTHARITVFDLLGREVAILRDEDQTMGTYLVEFRAEALASGVYFYRLQTSGFVQTRKLLLIR
jgi:hypothetical protein